MGFVKTCTKCGKTKPIEEFYKSPTGKYGVYSVCKECQRKEHKKYYIADLERRREMNRKYKERHQEKERLAKENAERMAVLKASEILGGYRIYVLNHCKEGESKYTCVKVATAEVYRTNDKRKFLSYLEGVI